MDNLTVANAIAQQITSENLVVTRVRNVHSEYIATMLVGCTIDIRVCGVGGSIRMHQIFSTLKDQLLAPGKQIELSIHDFDNGIELTVWYVLCPITDNIKHCIQERAVFIIGGYIICEEINNKSTNPRMRLFYLIELSDPECLNKFRLWLLESDGYYSKQVK